MPKNPSQNHDLPRPGAGEFEGTWGTDIMNNDMTQKLEERLVARDTEANLSNYEPYDEAIFISTDTGAVYDGDGSNWSKASRDFESVSTGEVANSSVGDEINYIDPRWVARSDALLHEIVPTPDRLSTNTTGSGGISTFSTLIRATTGTTSGSTARVRERRAGGYTRYTFDKDRTLRISVRIAYGTNQVAYVVAGSVDDPPYAGLKVEDNSLFAVTDSGNGEEKTDLGETVSPTNDFRLEWTADNNRIEVFRNGSSLGSHEDTDSFEFSRELWEMQIENTAADDKQIEFTEGWVVQSP